MAPRADLVIVGRIATLAGESGYAWQAGLAIAGGRVIALGSESEMEPLVGPQTVRWRLPADQVVVPGITDAHLHLVTLAVAETQLDLNGLGLTHALAAIGDRHRQMSAAGDVDGWLLGHGWSLHDLGRWPDWELLESVAPGRCVALYAHDHHSRWVSATAMSRAGIGALGEGSVAGLVRRDESGAPTGILHESAAALVDPVIPDPSADEVGAAIGRVAARLAALGITGCHDPGELTADSVIARGALLYRALAERGALPLRVHASIRAPQLERAIELGLASGQEVGGRYTLGWLKLFADGSLGSRSAALLAPYSDAASNPPTGGPRGMYVTDAEELAVLLTRAADAGLAGEVHAIGDAAVRTALDVLAGIRVRHDAGVTRRLLPRIEHAQLVDPSDQPRFGALGVAASVQPVHLRSDADQARAGWGERGEHAFPLHGLLDGGALIPFGSDAPVEPADPWPGIAVAVARRDPFKAGDPQLGAQHAIDLPRALRAACLDPALVAGQSDLGRLVPGHRADLLVVPSAAFGGPFDAATVAATRPLATLIDGVTVHRAAAFDL